MIAFTVYGDPVAKGRPKFFRKGNFIGAYTPTKTRDAETNFRAQAIQYKPSTPMEGPIVVGIVVFRKIPASTSKKQRIGLLSGQIRPITRPDVDNYSKLVCDALNGIFWRDDAQIVKLVAEKYSCERPRTSVFIREVTDAGI